MQNASYLVMRLVLKMAFKRRENEQNKPGWKMNKINQNNHGCLFVLTFKLREA